VFINLNCSLDDLGGIDIADDVMIWLDVSVISTAFIALNHVDLVRAQHCTDFIVQNLRSSSGRASGRLAAERLIPDALELGGKSPNIVFADADLDGAVDSTIGSIFEGSGQCAAPITREISSNRLAHLTETNESNGRENHRTP
jgi:hypothetical protein